MSGEHGPLGYNPSESEPTSDEAVRTFSYATFSEKQKHELENVPEVQKRLIEIHQYTDALVSEAESFVAALPELPPYDSIEVDLPDDPEEVKKTFLKLNRGFYELQYNGKGSKLRDRYYKMSKKLDSGLRNMKDPLAQGGKLAILEKEVIDFLNEIKAEVIEIAAKEKTVERFGKKYLQNEFNRFGFETAKDVETKEVELMRKLREKKGGRKIWSLKDRKEVKELQSQLQEIREISRHLGWTRSSDRSRSGTEFGRSFYTEPAGKILMAITNKALETHSNATLPDRQPWPEEPKLSPDILPAEIDQKLEDKFKKEYVAPVLADMSDQDRHWVENGLYDAYLTRSDRHYPWYYTAPEAHAKLDKLFVAQHTQWGQEILQPKEVCNALAYLVENGDAKGIASSITSDGFYRMCQLPKRYGKKQYYATNSALTADHYFNQRMKNPAFSAVLDIRRLKLFMADEDVNHRYTKEQMEEMKLNSARIIGEQLLGPYHRDGGHETLGQFIIDYPNVATVQNFVNLVVTPDYQKRTAVLDDPDTVNFSKELIKQGSPACVAAGLNALVATAWNPEDHIEFLGEFFASDAYKTNLSAKIINYYNAQGAKVPKPLLGILIKAIPQLTESHRGATLQALSEQVNTTASHDREFRAALMGNEHITVALFETMKSNIAEFYQTMTAESPSPLLEKYRDYLVQKHNVGLGNTKNFEEVYKAVNEYAASGEAGEFGKQLLTETAFIEIAKNPPTLGDIKKHLPMISELAKNGYVFTVQDMPQIKDCPKLSQIPRTGYGTSLQFALKIIQFAPTDPNRGGSNAPLAKVPKIPYNTPKGLLHHRGGSPLFSPNNPQARFKLIYPVP